MTYCIVTGMEFASRREMEEAYGIDSPEQLEAEMAERYAEWHHQHTMFPWHDFVETNGDEIPF